MATPRVSFTTPYFREAAAATADKVEAILDTRNPEQETALCHADR